jgi:PAS domain S-box-containing protein
LKPIQLVTEDDKRRKAAPAREPRGSKIPILIVDDQPANVFALESLLANSDYFIVKASCGSEALRCMLKDEFALVLLDVLMPGMDGFETAALIRKRPQSLHTPIIFITATSSDDDHTQRGYSLGAVDYIYKPIVPEILKTKVQVFVELHKNAKRLAASESALRQELESHKKAEEARRESEEKYRTLFARATDAIILFDSADGSVVEINKAAVDLYGHPRKEFLRLTMKDLASESAVGKGPDGADLKGTFELRHRKRGGESFPVELSSGPVSLGGRSLTMILARDITERRKAQEAELLREREAMQRQIVSTVSHELRTPIAAIKASAETLRMGELSDAKARPRFLKIIENQADRLGKLVEDLLILAEVESGKTKPVPSDIPLRRFVQEFVPSLNVLAKRRDVRIVIDVDADLVVRADRSHVSGILQNLIDNAIKYNKKGGSIFIEGRRTPQNEALISIRDTGIGIPESDLTLVFQQFHRTTKAKELFIKGTGLGLHLIKTMVQANGGRIWAESVEERGSIFHFTLPSAAPNCPS